MHHYVVRKVSKIHSKTFNLKGFVVFSYNKKYFLPDSSFLLQQKVVKSILPILQPSSESPGVHSAICPF